MVASIDTISQLIEIIHKHVDPDVFDKIIQELEHIQGNKSFKDTIRRIKSENHKNIA